MIRAGYTALIGEDERKELNSLKSTELIYSRKFKIVMCLKSFLLFLQTFSLFAQNPIQEEIDSMFYRYLNFSEYVKGGTVEAHWMNDGNSFWYVDELSDNKTIVKVDPVRNEVNPFFDIKRLKDSLNLIIGDPSRDINLITEDFRLTDNEESAIFKYGEQRILINLNDYKIVVLKDDKTNSPEIAPLTFKYRRSWLVSEKPSPDDNWFIGIEHNNIYIRKAKEEVKKFLTQDGTSDYWWEVSGWPEPASMWSPKGDRFVARKVDFRNSLMVPIVHYGKEIDSVQYLPYEWFDNVLPVTQIFIVPTNGGIPKLIESLEPGMGAFFPGWLSEGSECIMIQFNDRKIILKAINGELGTSRTILQEEATTGYLYTHPEREGRFTLLPEEDKFIWKSSRDGWDHLYLYSLNGTLIRKLTHGKFPVERLVFYDRETGWVYFTARADPSRIYDTHLYRVHISGSQLEQLTEQPGQHESQFFRRLINPIQFSPSGKYFLDSHSTVSRPPQVDLRRADGTMVRTLTKANTDDLSRLDWQPPEQFIVKAADDTTELHGVLYKPFNFRPDQKYPVIQYMYGSMDMTIVPRTFIPNFMGEFAQALAQLGFITTIIDVRGTGGRGKSFRDVVYGRVGDLEISDQVAALKQLAEKRPYIDLDRVGVVGGSYGGFMTVRAMLVAPEFYKVGVATAPVVDLRRHPNIAIMGQVNSANEYQYLTNIELADRLQGKLFIIHGTADEAIPFGEVMRLIDAFIKADKPLDMLIMPNETHGTDNIWFGYGVDAMKRYFLEHLKP